jgi:hypothetical protein
MLLCTVYGRRRTDFSQTLVRLDSCILCVCVCVCVRVCVLVVMKNGYGCVNRLSVCVQNTVLYD